MLRFLVGEESPYHFEGPGWKEWGINMSQTWKDSARKSTYPIVVEVATNDDGTYGIKLNEEVVGRSIPERWLDDELCGKRGFCGEELAEIKRQLRESGKGTLAVGASSIWKQRQ
jgi:hypothetical protein